MHVVNDLSVMRNDVTVLAVAIFATCRFVHIKELVEVEHEQDPDTQDDLPMAEGR